MKLFLSIIILFLSTTFAQAQEFNRLNILSYGVTGAETIAVIKVPNKGVYIGVSGKPVPLASLSMEQLKFFPQSIFIEVIGSKIASIISPSGESYPVTGSVNLMMGIADIRTHRSDSFDLLSIVSKNSPHSALLFLIQNGEITEIENTGDETKIPQFLLNEIRNEEPIKVLNNKLFAGVSEIKPKSSIGFSYTFSHECLETGKSIIDNETKKETSISNYLVINLINSGLFVKQLDTGNLGRLQKQEGQCVFTISSIIN